jgi:hypothetical protein
LVRWERKRLKYRGGYGCVEGNHLDEELVWFGGMIKVIGVILRGMVWFGLWQRRID